MELIFKNTQFPLLIVLNLRWQMTTEILDEQSKQAEQTKYVMAYSLKKKIVGPKLCAVNGREQRGDNIYIFFFKKKKRKENGKGDVKKW